ncbi:MAG: hypothetical protein AB8F95_09445 [Bacteroidia bacterium]
MKSTLKHIAISQDEALQFVKITCKLKRQPIYKQLHEAAHIEYHTGEKSFLIRDEFIGWPASEEKIFGRFYFKGADEGYFLLYSLKSAGTLISEFSKLFKTKHIKPFEIQWSNELYEQGTEAMTALYQHGGDPFEGQEVVMQDPSIRFKEAFDTYKLELGDEEKAFQQTIAFMNEEEKKAYPPYESQKMYPGTNGNMETLPVFLMLRAFATKKRFSGESSYSHSDAQNELIKDS